MLAFGIGANTAVFTLINSLVLKPRLGAADAELAGVYSRDRTQADAYRRFRIRTTATCAIASSFAVADGAQLLAAGPHRRHRHQAGSSRDVITANYFETFGVALLAGPRVHAGRGTAGREHAGGDSELRHVAAARRHGRGARLHRDDQRPPVQVVGVAPRGFGGSMVMVSPELYVPTGVYDTITNDFLREGLPATLADRRHHALILIARLAAGRHDRVHEAGARARRRPTRAGVSPAKTRIRTLMMAPLSRMSVSTSPQTDDGIGTLAMHAVLDVRAGAARGVLQPGEHAARARQRAAEGIRHPSGASAAAGFRIVRQLLAESLVLAVAGGRAWRRSWRGGPRELLMTSARAAGACVDDVRDGARRPNPCSRRSA